MTNQCKWCNIQFKNFKELHHHVYRGLCLKDPYSEIRKPL